MPKFKLEYGVMLVKYSPSPNQVVGYETERFEVLEDKCVGTPIPPGSIVHLGRAQRFTAHAEADKPPILFAYRSDVLAVEEKE